MFVAWVVFPLVLLAVCLGCGLAVEAAAGWRLRGALLPSIGLALVVVAASLTTSNPTTAPFTTAIVLALALAGYATGWRRMRALRPEGWPTAVGLGVFAICAAPVVLSGSAAFLGYFVLNDSAFHFALIDRLLAHGPTYSTLPQSSYSGELFGYITTSYPTGADVALGAVRPIVGQDVAWIFQPYLAVILGLGGAAIYELLRDVVHSRALRATCAFIAAQSGLVYAFYLEASIKELLTTLLLTVTVALVFETLRHLRLRSLIPLVIVSIAGLEVLEVAILPWLGPPLAVFVVAAGWRSRHAMRRMSGRRRALTVAGTAIVIAGLVAPLIGRVSGFVNTAGSVLTSQNELANLSGPLQKWQILGIWPSGDFRFAVEAHYRLVYALLGIELASAVLAVFWMVRRRALAPLLLLLGDGVAATYLLSRGSPYANAKVMMIFSVSVVLTAMLGGAALHQAGRRLEAWGLVALIGFGVLWTNVEAYRYSSVAPRNRLTELAAIGNRFSGQGPTLVELSDEFAIHFLRNEAPWLPYWAPFVQRAGLPARTEFQSRRLPWDPNDVDLSYLERFRLLVLGRSPSVSRPPANYRLAYMGRYYEVWRRTPSPTVLAHISLGGNLNPGAVPSCRSVLATAAQARREDAELAYTPRSALPVLVPANVSHPPNWVPVADDPTELIPRQGPGSVTGQVNVEQPGRFQVWLDGSFGQTFTVWVGRHRIGSISNQLGPFGQWNLIGSVTLAAGQQPVMIARANAGLSPDADEANPNNRLLGPLMLAPEGPPHSSVSVIPPRDARSLCGQRLNWIEVVR